MSAWCRACGHPQPSQAGPCPTCGTALEVGPPDESPLGLVFEVRGRMGVTKKQGICVDVEGDVLLLHFSPKDKEPGRVPTGTAPTAMVPASLSAATRLLYAADLTEARVGWDREMLRTRAAERCADLRALRRLTDEALELGWEHIVAWAPLTAGEKAWRQAHHAVVTSDLSALREALATLPPEGYPARAELLLPHLAVVHRDQDSWRPVLDTMADQQVPRAAELRDLVTGPWDAAIVAGRQFLTPERDAEWAAVGEQLATAASVAPPPVPGLPAWTAASLVLSADRSSPLDDAVTQLAGLERALWDDLVDAGRIGTPSAVTRLRGPLRTYLLARLDPTGLDDDELTQVEHLGELARRCFLSRDRATLSGLEPTARVAHYQALLDVVEDGPVDRTRLDDVTVATLEAPITALGEIKNGSLTRLPDDVAADPSLWPMFSDLAINGKLLADPTRSADNPLNIWIGVHRLLGLVWEGRFAEAVEHGDLLLRHTSVERVQDEVQSLIAYALDELGWPDEALSRLEEALKGEYTENLLVNASIIASRTRPEIGVRYLARLVEEAPTPDLQRAGLSQAISVWQTSDLEFPQVMVPALRSVLGTPLSIADYLHFGKIAVGVATDIVPGLRSPGGELDGPYRIIQAETRLKTDDSFGLADLATAYIDVYRSVGRPGWFNDEWSGWVSAAQKSVFVDFGDAAGTAMFVDQVLINAPELFTPEERFVLAPQAGAHLNAVFDREDGWLNAQAVQKFFFAPIDEFLSARKTLDGKQAELFADNFALCLGNAAISILGHGREDAAGQYNALVERLRWDAQDRYAIHSQMQRLLNDTEAGPVRLLVDIVERLRRLGSTRRSDLIRAVAEDLDEWREEIRRLRRGL
jgi:hypothetical protein